MASAALRRRREDCDREDRGRKEVFLRSDSVPLLRRGDAQLSDLCGSQQGLFEYTVRRLVRQPDTEKCLLELRTSNRSL